MGGGVAHLDYDPVVRWLHDDPRVPPGPWVESRGERTGALTDTQELAQAKPLEDKRVADGGETVHIPKKSTTVLHYMVVSNMARMNAMNRG